MSHTHSANTNREGIRAYIRKTSLLTNEDRKQRQKKFDATQKANVRKFQENRLYALAYTYGRLVRTHRFYWACHLPIVLTELSIFVYTKKKRLQKLC